MKRLFLSCLLLSLSGCAALTPIAIGAWQVIHAAGHVIETVIPDKPEAEDNDDGEKETQDSRP
jgi:hypothetical protein